jgi:hypothetical protein
MAKAPPIRVVVEVRELAGVLYQLERVRCGKEGCGRCPHGPYWYAYQRNPRTKKQVSRYIGRELAGAAAGKSNSKRSRRIAARAPAVKPPADRRSKRAA